MTLDSITAEEGKRKPERLRGKDREGGTWYNKDYRCTEL